MVQGHLVPDFPVNKIDQKGVYRRDLGSVAELADSIRQLGLLTPIVVTHDGLLLCGKRRLAAVGRLGWQTVPVWIPDKVSKNMRLEALFEDESLRKPLTPLEQAALYEEYRRLYAEQARLRYEATRFTTSRQPGRGAESLPTSVLASVGDGGAESPEPFGLKRMLDDKSRVKAAMAVTGTESHQRMEQILWLEAVAEDAAEDAGVRADAEQALAEIEADGKVSARWQRVQHHQCLNRLDRIAADTGERGDVREAATRLAGEARAQATLAQQLRRSRQGLSYVMRSRSPGCHPEAIRLRLARALEKIQRAEYEGLSRADPVSYGRFADEELWWLLTSYVHGVLEFCERAAKAARDPNQPPVKPLPGDDERFMLLVSLLRTAFEFFQKAYQARKDMLDETT